VDISIVWTSIGLATSLDLTCACWRASPRYRLKDAVGLGCMMKRTDLASSRSNKWYNPVCRTRHGFPVVLVFLSEYL
jgi:hypothetical protein